MLGDEVNFTLRPFDPSRRVWLPKEQEDRLSTQPVWMLGRRELFNLSRELSPVPRTSQDSPIHYTDLGVIVLTNGSK
jgi:hypothetical protein